MKTEQELALEQEIAGGKDVKELFAGKKERSVSETEINAASVVYENMTQFIATQFVNSVELIKQPILEIVSYKDVVNRTYRIEYFPAAESDATANGELPKSALTIADFNADDANPFTMYYTVDKQIYQKRQFNRSELFDMFKSGNGLSIVVGQETKNIKNVISRRTAGDLYGLLNDAETINKVVGIQDLSTLQVAKLIRKETIETETPSLLRITYTHSNGTTYAFEHQSKSTDYILVIDTNYENDKSFDIDGTKFNFGQFSIQYNKIIRLDFASIAEQYGIATFANKSAFLVETGAIMGAIIYDMSSLLPEPRFKVLREWALRYDFDKKLDKYVVSFDKSVVATDIPVEPIVKTQEVAAE